jgi:hypothetical protein
MTSEKGGSREMEACRIKKIEVSLAKCEPVVIEKQAGLACQNLSFNT